jgi:hypothetical protein
MALALVDAGDRALSRWQVYGLIAIAVFLVALLVLVLRAMCRSPAAVSAGWVK